MSAGSERAALCQPGRLVSLWDMIRLHAGELLSDFNRVATRGASLNGQSAFMVSDFTEYRDQINRLRDQCLTLGLNASASVAADLSGWITKALEGATAAGFVMMPMDIRTRVDGYSRDVRVVLMRELESRLILALSPEKERFYDQGSALFGAAVTAKFASSAVYEIDEACKCFALGRSTACVFHLMRCMEVAIAAVARCLSIPDPVKPADRNWGAILRKFNDEMGRRNALAAGWSAAGDRQFFEECYVSLDAVRNPWRNATMHVANKYTDEEAEHILGAVRGFMAKISGRMDENGMPAA